MAQELAASANIIPAVRSIYRWKGEIEESSEAYAILHTSAQHVHEIIRITNVAHPYDTAHILSVAISNASDGYRQWILGQT